MQKMKDSGVPWIGDIPEGWEVVKNKYISKMRSGSTIKSEEFVENGEFPVYGGNGLRGYFNQYTNEGIYILIGRQGALCGNVKLVEGKFWASEHAVVVYDNQLIIKKYYYYFLKSSNLNQYSSSAAQPGLAVENIENLRTCLPTLQDQQRIADFLDVKCARIDDTIAKEKELIEKLKEYRQSVITEAVTKGLNPSAPMKDSGIDWIGDIPEHWKLVTLGYLTKFIQTGPFGSQLHAEDYIEGGVPVINPAHLQHCKIIFDSACSITTDYAQRLSKHLLLVGDIVFARRGEMGRCAEVVAENNGFICGTGCLQIRPSSQKVNCRFLAYYLQTEFIRDVLKLNSVGTTMDNLNTSILSKLCILIPPLKEQQEIAVYLDKKTALIDHAINQKEQLIEKLNQYKKAFIYEAVTGKFEV